MVNSVNIELCVTLCKQRIYDNVTQHLHSDINNFSKLSANYKFKYSLESENILIQSTGNDTYQPLPDSDAAIIIWPLKRSAAKTVREHRFCKFVTLTLTSWEWRRSFISETKLKKAHTWYALFMNIYGINFLFLKIYKLQFI